MDLTMLSPRLATVAELASPCTVLADVGTDHARLPVFMIQQGLCSRAYACDVNDGPLQRAASAVAEAGLTDVIATVKSDGLHAVSKDYDALVIAGMGGDLIARILYECPPVEGARLILQPMTKPETLRRYLFRHGYSILRERAVSEGEKSYIILSVTRCPTESFCEEDCYLPQNLDCTPDAPAYLEKLLTAHQRRLLGLRRAEVPDFDAMAWEERMYERLHDQWKRYSRRLHDDAE